MSLVFPPLVLFSLRYFLFHSCCFYSSCYCRSTFPGVLSLVVLACQSRPLPGQSEVLDTVNHRRVSDIFEGRAGSVISINKNVKVIGFCVTGMKSPFFLLTQNGSGSTLHLNLT